MIYVFSDGELVQILNPSNNPCNPIYGYCGGCDQCLLMQAEYYGCEIKWEDEMPVKQCQQDGKPGFKWGDEGKCYTYTKGDEDSAKRARAKAVDQGQAIEASKRSS